MTLKKRVMETENQRQRRGRVWDTLRRVAHELEGLNVPYAVVGALALQHHGLLGRSTQDVDLLVQSTADLSLIHDRLIGRGFARQAPGSRHLRDEVTRVRVEFLLGGEFPGDGRPKPVAFPAPSAVSERADDGLSIINLRSLIELKLASARSAPHRIKDRRRTRSDPHAASAAGFRRESSSIREGRLRRARPAAFTRH
ncbi:hypothetical protein RAS1_40410 [Phycisphaerae bacterium RAS1]|nr:hypothetical protein RAS1_40410 [Phycisphaerae bacterium RAS1]